MKCKIEKAWSLTSPDGMPYRRFKIRFVDRVFYINEIDFKDSPELLIVMQDLIILKDSVNTNYEVTEELTEGKSIMILTPSPPAAKRKEAVLKPEALERIKEAMKKAKEKRETNAKEVEPSTTADDFSPDENESSTENQNIEQDSNSPIELIPEVADALADIDLNDIYKQVLEYLPYTADGFLVYQTMARRVVELNPVLNLMDIKAVADFILNKIVKGGIPSIGKQDLEDIKKIYEEKQSNPSISKEEKTDTEVEAAMNPPVSETEAPADDFIPKDEGKNEVVESKPKLNLFDSILDLGEKENRNFIKHQKTLREKFEKEADAKNESPSNISLWSVSMDEDVVSKHSAFIQDMLRLAVKEKVDDRTKDKLLKLINEEFSNKTSMELKILDEIRLLKGLITKKPEEEPPTPKQKFAHLPKNTVDFLRLFSYEDGSGFKELLHDTNFEVFTPDMIIEKVTHYPNFISKFHEKKVAGFKPIHKFVQAATVELITKFKTDGLSFIKKFDKHPYEVDKEYTNYAKQFKKNIRFGSGREYSDLYTTLIKIVNSPKFSNYFHPDQIIFLPDKRKFDIRSSFYTWVPSFINGVNYIFDGIKDHGNIAGVFDYPSSQKQIEIECWKESMPERILFLSFFDKLTLSTVLHLKAYEKLKASAARNKYFWSICNWDVEADFADGSYRFHLLGDEKEDSENITSLENPVGGFKHVLKFYDPEIS